MLPELSQPELIRYSRHLTLNEIGPEGQRRLKSARVLCVGAGGLGSPAAMYLAAAGVGTLGLVDFDAVELTNLHRQLLYSIDDVGRPKLSAAADRLRGLNPDINVVPHEVTLDASNALQLVSGYEVVIDGTDNFTARYLVNDACVMARKPNAWGSISRFEGQATIFAAENGPCYRCLHPEPPPPGLVPSCAEAGVLGVLPGIIGTIQATETIKLLLGIGEPLVGRFIIYDALRMRFRELKLARDPECAVCSDNPSILELKAYEGYCETGRVKPASGVEAGFSWPESAVEAGFSRREGAVEAGLPGLSAVEGSRPETSRPENDITVQELKLRMDRGDAPLVIDVREPHEHAICSIPGAILIPAAKLPQRLAEFDPHQEVVVHCRSGGRSSRSVALMREKGFTKARNLNGGVIAWVTEIDPKQPKY